MLQSTTHSLVLANAGKQTSTTRRADNNSTSIAATACVLLVPVVSTFVPRLDALVLTSCASLGRLRTGLLLRMLRRSVHSKCSTCWQPTDRNACSIQVSHNDAHAEPVAPTHLASCLLVCECNNRCPVLQAECLAGQRSEVQVLAIVGERASHGLQGSSCILLWWRIRPVKVCGSHRCSHTSASASPRSGRRSWRCCSFRVLCRCFIPCRRFILTCACHGACCSPFPTRRRATECSHCSHRR